MKIPENAPQWLKDATISEDAVFEIRIEFGIQIVDWKSGDWIKGFFNSGYFRGGYFRGGEFRGGYFLGGEFRGGYFLGGEFRGGVMGSFSKWFVGLTYEGNIKIGCKTMTVQEWDKWFKGKEEFETKRNTPEFKRIYASYLSIKAYKEEMDKK